MSDPQKELQDSEQFQSMPERTRNWILASPNAVSDFGAFFEKLRSVRVEPRWRTPELLAKCPPNDFRGS